MRALLALALLASCTPVCAQPDPNDDGNEEPPFSYLFLNGALTRDRDRSAKVFSDGFSLGGSVDLSESSFLSAGYSHSETGRFSVGLTEGEIEDDGYSIGFGGHKSLGRRTDLTTALAYVSSRTQTREVGGPKSEDRSEGASASLGLRHLLHPWVEFSGGSSYSFVAGESGWNFTTGFGLLMTRTVWMDLDYYRSGVDDGDGWSVGLRTVLGD
jgi:hypothetical protein